MQNTTPRTDRQATTSDILSDTPSDTIKSSAARKGGWTVRISPDVDLSAIRPPHFKLLVILEGLWRDRSYCWPTNETLAVLYGADTSNGASRGFRELLRELEADGWISRQWIDEKRPGAGRLGIFAHRRLNHDAPAEEGPPPPRESVKRLREARGSACTHGRKKPAPMAEKSQGGMAQKSHQNKDEFLNKDETNDDDKGRSSSSRSDPGGKTADPAIVKAVEAVRAFTDKPEGFVLSVLKKIPEATPEAIVAASKVPSLARAKNKLGCIRGTVANMVEEGLPVVKPPPPPSAPPRLMTQREKAAKVLSDLRAYGFPVSLSDAGEIVLGEQPPMLNWRTNKPEPMTPEREEVRRQSRIRHETSIAEYAPEIKSILQAEKEGRS